jgi:HD-GYP domain-containing protein (c-di-GMP phosphodiesterase class II)
VASVELFVPPAAFGDALRTHSVDVSRYVAVLAARLGIDDGRRQGLLVAALLHDVGKLGVSDGILLKPGPLTAAERAAVERHASLGAAVVSVVPELRQLAPAVRHHHERWDGAGYPARLRGAEIPLGARLIGIADAFAAMLADRPYSPARSVADACAELERCAGTQFDPALVPVFLETVEPMLTGSDPGKIDPQPVDEKLQGLTLQRIRRRARP